MPARCRFKAGVLGLLGGLPGSVLSAAGDAEPPSRAPDPVALQEVRIPMPDGVHLAADLWLPAGSGPGEAFPVLLEYLPYRKDEDRAGRYPLYRYFVERGYVVARVDIRGTGASEGELIEYEYTEQEQRDGEAVIDWLAKQAFSSGKVGMFGISWGGFNSIHMAMRNPPALAAIIAIEATDDLYEDDVHYIDGMAHVDAYEIGMDIANAMPGAPDFLIDEAYFRNRFDRTPWLLIYKRQQRDGPFWNRASLNERYAAIRIPTYVIGGWYDGYRDSVPRMLEHVAAPIKAMIGPWSHTWPHEGFPGESIEWRHEAVRWFDQWLKGRDTGILDEPRFAVFVRHWHPPGTGVVDIPGEWRWEEGWPIERVRRRVLYPAGDHGLQASIPAQTVHRLDYRPTVGIEAGGPVMWYGDLGWDQRPVDAFSLVYQTAPLEEEVEILGFARARLETSVDAPLAYWFVRICDVAPDGRVTQVAAGGLNAAHRESAAEPRPLGPGEITPLEIELHLTSWVFGRGHRIRVAVNNAQWPMIWPTPHAMTTSLHLGPRTQIELPVVSRADRPRPQFLEPAGEPAGYPGYGGYDSDTPSGYSEIGLVERDYHGQASRAIARNAGTMRYPWGKARYSEQIVHEAHDLHPEAASVVSEFTTTVELADRVLGWHGVLDFRSDRENFYYTYTRRLMRDGALVRERTWRETIARDHH